MTSPRTCKRHLLAIAEAAGGTLEHGRSHRRIRLPGGYPERVGRAVEKVRERAAPRAATCTVEEG